MRSQEPSTVRLQGRPEAEPRDRLSETQPGGRDSIPGGPGSTSVPDVPESLDDTGLSSSSVQELVLKVLMSEGTREGGRLAESLRLPFTVLDEELPDLQRRHLVAVRGTDGGDRRGYEFELTERGQRRARDALDRSRYVGPAPVPLEQYAERLGQSSVRQMSLTRSQIRTGLEHLVLSQEFVDTLGPAINSGKSVFLYGSAGNGKTAIAEAIAGMMDGTIYLPYAIESEGQIIRLYDPVFHREAPLQREEPDAPWLRAPPRADPRFVRVERPVVTAGGELTLDQLDLQWDAASGLCRAPAQLKANGGVFIIDDFGRQRVPPRNLLNRWMIPLDRGSDYLTFPTGHRVEVPFDCLLVFATNMDPRALVEEAFLRRIQYKIQVPSPGRSQYEEIFRRQCASAGISYSPAAVDHIYDHYYRNGVEPRGCHPRDIVSHLRDLAAYLDVRPSLSNEMLGRACSTCFLDVPPAREETKRTTTAPPSEEVGQPGGPRGE